MLADVGLLGMPNAGKSTFIAQVSNARPKVADYPFTTLHPNLGVVRVADERSFVVADVPGLIEGAAEGAGLGHQFLRHLQRTRLLLHLVDLSPFDDGRDPVAEARAIVKELRKYDAALYEKPRWLVLNKLDTLEGAAGQRGTPRAQRIAEFKRRLRWHGPTFEISGLTGEGCETLCRAIWEHLDRHREPVPPIEALDAASPPAHGTEPVAPEVASPAAPDPHDPRFRPLDPA